MVPNFLDGNGDGLRVRENVAYIRQILGELRNVAQREGADMLCYLIEMAYLEAGDIQAGRRGLSVRHGQRD
ncbi:hypothetical protein [Ciceribacter ferrooxidans]|uniref:Uncharacterized protein n=1 Tax=Ciceribacter ferrooxidans TaxID=2509717 RepID=A0A4Q2TE62_9HYPH|nr:hypothetical protein [Ciceribacter ferrooxidans]RYC17613.1 hypothetical protein EUU22_06435 [Ciceribacter ferrooxidans]